MSETITPDQPTEATPAASAAPVAPPAPIPAPKPEPAKPTEPATPEPATGPDLAAEVAKWKELSRKNEARAKENAEARKKLDEIEEANKTEMERYKDRAEAAEKAAAEAVTESLRAKKAAESGVSIGLIPAGTEEQMDAAIAAAIAFKDAAVAEATKRKPSPAAPAEIVTAAHDSTQVKQITSRDELKSMTPAEIMAAQKDGRLDQLMGKIT